LKEKFDYLFIYLYIYIYIYINFNELTILLHPVECGQGLYFSIPVFFEFKYSC